MEQKLDNLRELTAHPGWQSYLDALETMSVQLFGQMFQLDMTNPSSITKIIELKSKIDCLRDITYFIEREIAPGPEEVDMVDKSFGQRVRNMLKRLWRRNEK